QPASCIGHIAFTLENKPITNQTFSQMYKTSILFCCCPRQLIFRTLLTMKLVFLLLTAAFLHASATGYAQRVTINVKQASITSVLDKIRQQTGYDFLYNSAHLTNTKPVDLQFENTSLSQVLDACFADQPLTYQIVDN